MGHSTQTCMKGNDRKSKRALLKVVREKVVLLDYASVYSQPSQQYA